MPVTRKTDPTAATLEAVATYRAAAERLRGKADECDLTRRPMTARIYRHKASIASRAAYAELHPEEGA